MEVSVNGGEWTQPAVTPELEPDHGPEPATVAEARKWLTDNGYNVGKRGRIAAQHKADYTRHTGRVVL